jgi:hypothetical protein
MNYTKEDAENSHSENQSSVLKSAMGSAIQSTIK